jgi:glycosyltransferase involved in cell wall biosynthesis
VNRRIVGVVLVRNEDLHVEQVIRNIASFCDVIHVGDNGSTDGTWDILQSVAADLDHVRLARLPDLRRSQSLVEEYAGTPTWVFGVDGDELYDPSGLARLRRELLDGAYDEWFRVKSNVLNAVEVDRLASTATGYLAPPSRPITKLFNFGTVERWRGPSPQALHGGDRVLRPGVDPDASHNIGDRLEWGDSHFRCLHCCFVQRSSADPPALAGIGRMSPIDMERRDARWSRRLLRATRRGYSFGSAWKIEKYQRGPLVTVDITGFLG